MFTDLNRVGVGVMATAATEVVPGISDWSQLGALAILAVYFLVVDPNRRKQEREFQAQQAKEAAEFAAKQAEESHRARRDELHFLVSTLWGQRKELQGVRDTHDKKED